MTVNSQVKQALATAKSVQANFETFALQTKDETARRKYDHAAQQIQSLISELEMRVAEIEQEEPEFRG
ncbi:DUF1657 domain-containing protein [Alkalihalobacillus sp. BA299]|uniref:DUF1657 domain-containing protein n=1 Tax=Alkalihalobacillus sp. BA299 TaxID=2815938 RepID=UPI001ADD553B|nr:DUF1657 domain-containing protein [Alkalihalobacillus sp. BA299]